MNENDLGKSGSQRERHPQRQTLPDPAICRAVALGTGLLVHCLVEGPSECTYAMFSGPHVFCNHPDRLKTVEQSRAEQKKKKS
ncbi:MAG: hypothetical protein WCV00_00480 [Verrucomicrobiia bacterium]